MNDLSATRLLQNAGGRGETVHFGSFLKRVTGGIPGTWLYACGGGQ